MSVYGAVLGVARIGVNAGAYNGPPEKKGRLLWWGCFQRSNQGTAASSGQTAHRNRFEVSDEEKHGRVERPADNNKVDEPDYRLLPVQTNAARNWVIFT